MKYVPSMSVSMRPIPAENGFYSFAVDRDVFDGGLKGMVFEVIPGENGDN